MTQDLFGRRLHRRDFLKLTGGLAAAAALPAGLLNVRPVLAAPLRQPGTLPFPTRPAGVPQPDLAPELANIDHIIIVMMENHSFDNYFGMLPYRVPALAGRVDGWPSLDGSGNPVPAVPQKDSKGVVHSPYPMPDGCQPGGVSQAWDASHHAYDAGAMDGFLIGSSPQALGYWDQQLLPFYYSLASSFPVCDRYFCSTLCQTYPNRVFLMAGTAGGLTATQTPPPTNLNLGQKNIFQTLTNHALGWVDYYSELPTPGLLDPVWAAQQEAAGRILGPFGAPQATVAAFEAACLAGTLPPVVMVESEYQYASEENPQNIQVGQTFVAGVINALIGSPSWARSLLVFTYDEHGGYYDHVVPPPALNPGDGSSPSQPPVGSTYGDDYTTYGFRVPTVIVSPWAKQGFTSHTLYDHTSILATIERKWNLPALTLRDANANHLGDCLVAGGPAPFATPPALAAAPLRTEGDSIVCEQTGSDPFAPGTAPAVGAPEVPGTALLGGAGVATAAGFALRRRHRSQARTYRE